MTNRMAQIALMLTVYLSIAVAVGSCITFFTQFFFVTTETRLFINLNIRYDPYGIMTIYVEQRGFPLAFQVEEHLGWITIKREFISNNLLWDIAFHTFAALGIVGILVVESKKSKLRAYDLIAP